MNRNPWVPVAAVTAVLAVLAVVSGVSVLSRDGGAAGPPVLRLAGADIAVSASGAGARGGYRLTGTLPSGPSEARVRDLPAMAAPVDQVRALAAALGETAEPARVDGAWTSGKLRVTDEPGNPWTWGRTCGPDTPVSSDGAAMDLASSQCAYGIGSSGGTVSSGTVSPSIGYACPSPPTGAEPVDCDGPGIPLPLPLPPEKPLVTKSQAMTATAAVRDALGQGDAPTRVEGLSVVVEPVAGGLPTIGLETLLQLSGEAKLVGASGSLSIGQEGALYPLRTAREAFDGMPVFAMGAPCDAAGCPEGPAVTGARLGLSRMALDGGFAALVPAWLFTVEGSSVPLVALAVADRFLGGPEPGQTEPAPKPDPNQTEPDTEGRQAFAFDAAYPDADPFVLVVRYGDSGSCPSQAVRHEVVQEPNRVVVTLTRTPAPADQACTMDYRAMLVRVALTAPLGSREVVDGSRKEPIPVSTASPPFG